MEKPVTFGKLLAIIIIVAIPFFYWIYSIESRVGKTEDDYDLINTKVLNAINKVNTTLHSIEHSLKEKEELNYYIKDDGSAKREG